MQRLIRCLVATSILGGLPSSTVPSTAFAADGNRLTYLNENDPYYPHTEFPKLITPQWVGEEGVEAVVILAIDDMRDTAKYESYLRPILDRLKAIDGRAPVSIMTNRVDPQDPQLQQWLDEGLSIEAHTIDHPCPLLQGGDFEKAKSTYDRCVDLLHEIPNSEPVAFRMPCCDSLNTVSPRFYAEIFDETTENGHYLSIDSSVFNFYTADDPEIPRELVLDEDGRDRFLKYLPKDLKRNGKVFDTFVNYIENYPYPYVINRTCWEFPCMAPSDWSAQHYHGVNNPKTVADWKAALDITVKKQGVFTMVFHPHGWIENTQIVDLIDYADETYGERVKFLTFKEALRRLNENLLKGHPLRDEKGRDNGVRVLDVDNDGYMDVVIAHGQRLATRIWSSEDHRWRKHEQNVATAGRSSDPPLETFDLRYGILHEDGFPTLLITPRKGLLEPREQFYWNNGFWHFSAKRWQIAERMQSDFWGHRIPVKSDNLGFRFRDLNRDGRCELIMFAFGVTVLKNKLPKHNAVILTWSPEDQDWKTVPFSLPGDIAPVTEKGQDAGLRFVDLNEDGHDDIVFSNHKRYGIWLFEDMQSGWSIEVLSGKRGAQAHGSRPVGLPPIVRKDGSDNGFFVKDRHLFWQNEDTADKKDLVARRSFNELLKGVEPQPKSPRQSLESIRVRPGFEVELAAAEPLVRDPIAFDWGTDGRLWVVEMADYPLGAPPPQSPPSEGGDVPAGSGRVRFLEDTDGDGRYDESTLFAEGLAYPTSIMTWRDGVLVTAGTDILFLEDRDGDGRADERKALYTGFQAGNPQHRANGLRWGLDNWIYLSKGQGAVTVTSTRTGETVESHGRDLKIRPDTGEMELVSGHSQFGRVRDDRGNWFGCNNSHPMWQFPLQDHYLRRNPHFSPPGSRVEVPEIPGNAPVYPVSRTLKRFNDPTHANRFTSACSAMVYRDNVLGTHYRGNMFVCEPVHNLVHREVMEPEGVTFRSHRAPGEEEAEFLASSDNWFRPVMVRTGPDGALWIADMYRYVIEHPKWIPDDWQQRLDLRAGHDKGRIYRVVPQAHGPRPVGFRLDELSTKELIDVLNSPNGWLRDKAQQVLLWREDESAVKPLRQRVTGGSRDGEKQHRHDKSALGRLHALCTLDGLDALTADVVRTALRDPHPGVRRHAVRLSERFLEDAGIREALLQRLDDADPHVRMQLAYTLGEWDGPQAGRALGRLALEHADDRYLSAAVMSSIDAENIDEVLITVLSKTGTAKSADSPLSQLLELAGAFRNPRALRKAFAVLVRPAEDRLAPWRFSALADLLEALDRNGQSWTDLRKQAGPKLQEQMQRLPEVFQTVRTVAEDANASPVRRSAAVQLLGWDADRRSEDVERLAGLLAPQHPPAVQRAAVDRLGGIDHDRIPELLLSAWRTYTPDLRAQVTDLLLSRKQSTVALLDALKEGLVRPGEIDAVRRQRLLEHGDAELRRRAKRLFAGGTRSDRAELVEEYQTRIKADGNRERGRRLFEEHCAACHKLEGVGEEVGPDLTALTDKSTEALLTALLDPGRAVEAKYLNYVAVTRDGRTFNGLLAEESGNSITLVGPDGKQQKILRTDLELLKSTGRSAMPEGLEKELTPRDAADVIRFVRTAR